MIEALYNYFFMTVIGWQQTAFRGDLADALVHVPDLWSYNTNMIIDINTAYLLFLQFQMLNHQAFLLVSEWSAELFVRTHASQSEPALSNGSFQITSLRCVKHMVLSSVSCGLAIIDLHEDLTTFSQIFPTLFAPFSYYCSLSHRWIINAPQIIHRHNLYCNFCSCSTYIRTLDVAHHGKWTELLRDAQLGIMSCTPVNEHSVARHSETHTCIFIHLFYRRLSLFLTFTIFKYRLI